MRGMEKLDVRSLSGESPDASRRADHHNAVMLASLRIATVCSSRSSGSTKSSAQDLCTTDCGIMSGIYPRRRPSLDDSCAAGNPGSCGHADGAGCRPGTEAACLALWAWLSERLEEAHRAGWFGMAPSHSV